MIDGRRVKSIIESPSGDFLVGCGICRQCKKQRITEWSLRLTHEWNYNKNSMFITLTYTDEKLPTGKYKIDTIKKTEIQKFMKRLRQNVRRTDSTMGSSKLRTIKYYGCGEYGEDTQRPHYHMLLYGVSHRNPDDCHLVEKSWDNGFVDIGYVSPASIRYSLKYINKQVKGPLVYEDYICLGIEPPFKLASTKLGAKWFIANKRYVIDDGYIKHEDKKIPVPRYYRKMLQEQTTKIEFDTFTKNDIRFRKEIQDEEIKQTIDVEFERLPFGKLPWMVQKTLDTERIRVSTQTDLNLKAKSKIFNKETI